MIEINLVPKDYLKRSFDFSLGKAGLYGVVGAAAVLVTLVVISLGMQAKLSSLEGKIEKARQKEIMLQKDIQLVDALTDVKKKITHRMKAVERLDSHRSAWVRILEDVARNVPEFVWLGRFQEDRPEAAKDKKDKKSKKGKTTEAEEAPMAKSKAPTGPTIRKGEVEGYAFTLNALASFMIKMMRSDYFEDVELVTTNEINIDDKKAYNFVLSFNIHYLSDEELRNLIASSEAEAAAQSSKTSHKSLN